MRKTIKFLHTMGAIGFLGAILALLVLHASLPEPSSSVERFATLRIAMGSVAEWGSFLVVGAVAVLNVVLGVWRPRFTWWPWRPGASEKATAAGSAGATQP